MVRQRTESTGSRLVQREILLGKGADLRDATNKHYPRNFVDTLSSISPGWKGNRESARMEKTIMAGGYNVTQPSRTRRRRGNHGADGAADNATDDQTLWELREECRDHDRNSALLHGIIERSADNIAGPEYLFRPNSGDKAFDDDAAEALKSMRETAEFRGLFNFQEVIHGVTRALMPDGDTLIHTVKGGRLQMIESHDLVTPIGGKGHNGRRIVGGVELDSRGRHRAYLVRDPRNKQNYGFSHWISDHKEAHRIPIDHARLVANRHRFSQTRGVPTLAPAMDMFDRLDAYMSSEMIAAKLDADVVRGITRQPNSGQLGGIQTQTDLNADGNSETSFDKLLRSEAGMILDLREGENLVQAGGTRPGDNFEPYIVTVMRMVGACVGQPLELVLLDFSRTNYSSARAALLQAYRKFMCYQVFLREHLIQPIYNDWMTRWIASGDLAPVDNAYRLEFIPPRWAWIDPLKEVLAKEKEIAAGAGTLDGWINETGKFAETLYETRANELADLKERGIPTTTAPNNLVGDSAGKQKQMENITKAVKAGVPVAIAEARATLGLDPQTPEGKLLRFNDQDVLQYHIENGVLTINEAREILGLAPVAWGNKVVQKTTITTSEAGDATEKETEEDEETNHE